MRPMAFDKLCQLIGSGSPTCRLITNNKHTDALVAAGLMAEDGSGFCITPNGLRRLADQMEAGHVAAAIKRLKAEAAERYRKRHED